MNTAKKRMTVLVRDLRAGDFVVDARATVAAVDCFGACAIIDFTDGTATAPILALIQCAIDRAAEVTP